MCVWTSAAAFIIMERRQMHKQGQDDRGQAVKRIAKADFLLLFVLLLLGIAGVFTVRIMTQKSGASVRVLVHGEIYGTYGIEQEQSIKIRQNGSVTNVLQISEGKAKMVQADCPDKLCVHQNAIAKQGETIVCLPNQVVVEIEGEEASDLDAVAR